MCSIAACKVATDVAARPPCPKIPYEPWPFGEAFQRAGWRRSLPTEAHILRPAICVGETATWAQSRQMDMGSEWWITIGANSCGVLARKELEWGFGKRTAQGGRPGHGRQHAFTWAEEAGNRKPMGDALLIYRPRVRSDGQARSAGTAGPTHRTEAAPSPTVPALTRPRRDTGEERGAAASAPRLTRPPRSCHPFSA